MNAAGCRPAEARARPLAVLFPTTVPVGQFLLVSRETLGDEQVEGHLEVLGCSSGCSGSSLLRMEDGTMLITPSTSSHSSTTQLTSSGPSPGASCGSLGLGLGLGLETV